MARPPAQYSHCRFGFRPGDPVWTPLRRKAVLTKYRISDERWDARYLAKDGSPGGEGEETTLDPAKLVRA